jgi:hypothetical protein
VRSQELTEAEFRLLLALDAARGDLTEVGDQLRTGGLSELPSKAAKKKILESLETKRLIKGSEDREYYALTDGGRQACREKVNALGELIEYARKTLRW